MRKKFDPHPISKARLMRTATSVKDSNLSMINVKAPRMMLKAMLALCNEKHIHNKDGWTTKWTMNNNDMNRLLIQIELLILLAAKDLKYWPLYWPLPVNWHSLIPPARWLQTELRPWDMQGPPTRPEWQRWPQTRREHLWHLWWSHDWGAYLPICKSGEDSRRTTSRKENIFTMHLSLRQTSRFWNSNRRWKIHGVAKYQWLFALS